jgi:hypothetical protein
MLKISFISLLFISQFSLAQVSVITRDKSSYTKDVFPYKGTRAMMIEEVNCGEEETVFLFSKIDKGAKVDEMYFQRYTKSNEKWALKKDFEIKHEGIISILNNRKWFADFDKDRSADVVFIYTLNNADFKQQSVHLLLSHLANVYTIASTAEDDYTKDVFSENFEKLDAPIKAEILQYWQKLDKKDD